MTKNNKLLPVAISVALFVLLGSIGAAARTPVPWADYVPPESFFMGMDATGSYQYYDDQYADDRGNINHGTLKLRYWQFMDGPTAGYDINLALTLNTKTADDDDGISFALNSGGHTSYKHYFDPAGDTFVYGGLTANTSSSFDGLSVIGNAGVGYGRFKDVTPMGRASEIEKTLLDLGDLPQPFGPAFLIALAQETERIHTEEETEYERAQRVAEFINDNAPGSPILSPAGVIAVSENLRKGVNRRTYGWEVRGGIGYPLLVPDDGERKVQLVASAGFGMPIGFDTQVNLSAQASTPVQDLANAYTVGLQGDVTHAINEALNVGANFTHSTFSSGDAGDNTRFAWSVGAFADYQILSSLTLVTAVTLADDTNFEEATFDFTAALRFRLF